MDANIQLQSAQRLTLRLEGAIVAQEEQNANLLNALFAIQKAAGFGEDEKLDIQRLHDRVFYLNTLDREKDVPEDGPSPSGE